MKWLCVRFAVSALSINVPLDALAKDEFSISCEELAVMQAGAGGQDKSLNELL